MTLEDFFTPTELKDGLMDPVRVNGLLSVMQNQKDDITKNVTEATRHWSAVANTIAATENKDCLDLFVQLDGLSFIDKWLNDAQKFENDTGNKYLEEELIDKLLGAIERLQIDNDKSVSSGIAKTVQNLVANGSSVVSDKAKALCDMWTLISLCKNDNEENVQKNGDKEETAPTKEAVMDPVDSSIINISVKNETENSKLEGTTCEEKSDVSELDKCVEDAKEKQESDKSSGSEQKDVSSSADVENILESAMNGDTSDTSDSSAEDLKLKSDSESDEGYEDGKKDDSGNGSRFSELPKARDGDLMSNRPSDMEMDYGIVDPLEVARQVAMEVEQEVDDSREEEQSCSTSRNEKPKSPDSTNQKEPLNAEKGFSGFDLNQEVSSEEIDHPDDPILTPISVVSASRAAAAEGLPAAPLQFEGALGWKGSAATSAFRPIPEVPSRQRLDRLDFDLNVAEDGDDKTNKTEKTETSIQRLQLDLNSLGDDDADVIRSSSSSSSIQPYFRNIDLNNTFLGNAYKQDESVISIFGTQVQIKQQPNGTIFDPPTDFSLGRAGPLTHYANLPAYGHNGFTFAPPGAPIPYMGSRAPFMFNMGGTGSNGAGPSRHGFDLNLDNNNNNTNNNNNNNNNGGLRQFLNIGGKRQEPDSGWEAYPINYKHQQPPWQ